MCLYMPFNVFVTGVIKNQVVETNRKDQNWEENRLILPLMVLN